MDNSISPYVVPKSGETRYRVDLAFVHDGTFHRYRKQGFRTAKDAASWARKTELVIRTGGKIEPRTRQSGTAGDDPRAWTVDQLFDRLVEYWTGRLKPSSVANYRSSYAVHLQHLVGRKKWADLTQRDLDAIARAPWRGVATFAAMRKAADSVGAVGFSARWRPPKHNPGRRLIFLEPDEARRALELLPPEYRPIFLFALGTGCRLGECLAIRWGDIDFRRRLIHVERQLSAFGGVTTPKSGKSRIIPMSHTAEQALGMLSRGSADDPVFAVTRNGVSEAMRALQEPLGKPVTFHVLRHTAASWSLQAGVPDAVVAGVLGHSSTQLVSLYGHLRPDHLAASTDAIDAALTAP